MEDSLSEQYRFGRLVVDPSTRQASVDGHPAALGSRAFDLLLALVERRDRVVLKSELLDVVWPGLVVEENNLQVQISALRKLLGQKAIATIPGRGYRFLASALDGREQTVATAATNTQRTNLARPLPELFGREHDLRALDALIEQRTLVSVVGAGGMGKTLLAQHLLDKRRDQYQHGVWWVELGPITDPSLIPGTIAAALDLELEAGDQTPALCKALAGLKALIALDNAEHLLAELAMVVRAVMVAAPEMRFLVTTQAPVNLAAEWVYRIDSLAVPDGSASAAQAGGFSAIQLFVERARSLDTRFELNETNVSSVIDLCRQLDGMPLAIELAAARAPMLGVQQLARSMQDRLRLLNVNRNRDAVTRLQTLRGALEWSHGLLAQRERAVFRRLAVFVGSASLDSIRAVVTDAQGELDEWAVMDALGILVARSLVVVKPALDGVTQRFRLLDSPRLFALERLTES